MFALASPGLALLAQFAVLLLITLGCWLVLDPFLPAILFSIAIAASTWPVHQWLLTRLGGRQLVASLLSCLLVTLVVVTPITLLLMSLSDGAGWLLRILNDWHAGGQPQLPEWIVNLPLFGEQLKNWWIGIAQGGSSLDPLFAQLAEPARRTAIAIGRGLGNGLLQVGIAAILLFFLFRDGERFGRRVQALAVSLGGAFGGALLVRVQQTIVAIMLSVIGAALAQATVATIGFQIAGVPNPLLLGALTFALSIVPIGPPLIWGGASLWLFEHGQTHWGLFMLIYGVAGISSIDNILKPILISRSSRLPFAATLIGVIGGVIAFGVPGVFLGPILLSLALEFFRIELLRTAVPSTGDHPQHDECVDEQRIQ